MNLRSVALGPAQIAIISRLMARLRIIETMPLEHIRTGRAARAWSERPGFIVRSCLHAGHAALISYAVLHGASGPARSVIEKIFGLPGARPYFVTAPHTAITRSWNGAIIVLPALIVILTSSFDVLYAVLDPKVKYD